MPAVFGKDSRKKELIQKLPEIFGEIQREHQISPGDFPDVVRMQEQLQHQVDWSLVSKLSIIIGDVYYYELVDYFIITL